MTENKKTNLGFAAYALLKATLLPVLLVFFSSAAATVLAMTPAWLAALVCVASIAVVIAIGRYQNLHFQWSLIVAVLALAIPWLASIFWVPQVGTAVLVPCIVTAFAVIGAIAVAWMLPRTLGGTDSRRLELAGWVIALSAFVFCLLMFLTLNVPYADLPPAASRKWEFVISAAVMTAIFAFTIRWPNLQGTSSSSAVLGVVSVSIYAVLGTLFSLSSFFSFTNAELAACKRDLLDSHLSIEAIETEVRELRKEAIRGGGIDELQNRLEYSRLLRNVGRLLRQDVDSTTDLTLRYEIASELLPVASFSRENTKEDVASTPLTLANLLLMNSRGGGVLDGVSEIPALAFPQESVQKNATEILEELFKFVRSGEPGSRIPAAAGVVPADAADSDAADSDAADSDAADSDAADSDAADSDAADSDAADSDAADSDAADSDAIESTEKMDEEIQKFLTSPKYGQRALAEVGAFLTMANAPNGYWTRYLHTTVRGPIQYVTLIVFWASLLPAVSFILLLIRDSRNMEWLNKEFVIFHRMKRMRHAAELKNLGENSTSLEFPSFAMQIKDVEIHNAALASCIGATEGPAVELPQREPPTRPNLNGNTSIQIEKNGDERFSLKAKIGEAAFCIAVLNVLGHGNGNEKVTGITKDKDADLNMLLASGLGWASDWIKFNLNIGQVQGAVEFSFTAERDNKHTLASGKVSIINQNLTGNLDWNEQAKSAILDELRLVAMKECKCYFRQSSRRESEIEGSLSVTTEQSGSFTVSLSWNRHNHKQPLLLSNLGLNLDQEPITQFDGVELQSESVAAFLLESLNLEGNGFVRDHLKLVYRSNPSTIFAFAMLQVEAENRETVEIPMAELQIIATTQNGFARIDVLLQDYSSRARAFSEFHYSLSSSDTAPFGLEASIPAVLTETTRPSIVFETPGTKGREVLTISGITAPRNALEDVRFDEFAQASVNEHLAQYLRERYFLGNVEIKSTRADTDKLNLSVWDAASEASPIASLTLQLRSEGVVLDDQIYHDLQKVLKELQKQSPSTSPEEVHSCSLVARVLNGARIMGTREAMYGVLEQGCSELDERTDSRMELVRYGAWLAPSFGFIGTIYGIGSALLGSEKMVTADEASQGAEISAVSQTLGSAFDTTMVALILSMGLVFLIHISTYLTSSLVIAFRRFANTNLIERFEGSDAAENGGDQ